ncbi:2760_t:CDS:2 [Entrophospora sp. SA101]|nr:2760_t:CDS:2 [Entrophospora sp. SA101]
MFTNNKQFSTRDLQNESIWKINSNEDEFNFIDLIKGVAPLSLAKIINNSSKNKSITQNIISVFLNNIFLDIEQFIWSPRCDQFILEEEHAASGQDGVLKSIILGEEWLQYYSVKGHSGDHFNDKVDELARLMHGHDSLPIAFIPDNLFSISYIPFKLVKMFTNNKQFSTRDLQNESIWKINSNEDEFNFIDLIKGQFIWSPHCDQFILEEEHAASGQEGVRKSIILGEEWLQYYSGSLID